MVNCMTWHRFPIAVGMARGVTDNVASGIQDDCGASMGRHLVAVRLVSVVFLQPATNAEFMSIESEPILHCMFSFTAALPSAAILLSRSKVAPRGLHVA